MESGKKTIASAKTNGITALIVDDEPGAINSLRHMLREYCPEVQEVFAATSVKEAVETAATTRPQLVFLDIEMPPLGSGFDFLKNCGEVNFGIIFTTAYPQYAIRAINTIQPWAYLVKPFSVSELKAAIAIAVEKINRAAELSGNNSGIVLHDSRKGDIVLLAKNILLCKAAGSFTEFYVLNNQQVQKITASGCLGEFEAKLPKQHFCRTHHSFLVNLSHIKRIEHTGRNGIAYLTYANMTADVSVSKMEHFLQRLETYLEEKTVQVAL